MEERAKKILETARDLARRGGFEAVRLREVAADAGVALGTLYKRFHSKEDLLVAALEAETDELVRALRQRPVIGADRHGRAAGFFEVATRRLCRRPRFARAVLRAVASGDPELSRRVMTFHDRIKALILEAVADGEAGEPDERLDQAAYFLQRIWFAALVGWSGGLQDLDEVLREMRAAAELLIPVADPPPRQPEG